MLEQHGTKLNTDDVARSWINLLPVGATFTAERESYLKLIQKSDTAYQFGGKRNFDLEEIGTPLSFSWGKCKLATTSYGHGITTTLLQIAKGYSIVTNGGYDINPTMIQKKIINKHLQKRILNVGVSDKINKILRKIVTNEEGTAELANVKGYEVGGKTGTAQISKKGRYTRDKINTFAAVFPSEKPRYTLVVMMDEPKTNSEYIYHYRDDKQPIKGTPYNTAGWTSVEVAGKIIERIGPILATKYIEN